MAGFMAGLGEGFTNSYNAARNRAAVKEEREAERKFQKEEADRLRLLKLQDDEAEFTRTNAEWDRREGVQETSKIKSESRARNESDRQRGLAIGDKRQEILLRAEQDKMQELFKKRQEEATKRAEAKVEETKSIKAAKEYANELGVPGLWETIHTRHQGGESFKDIMADMSKKNYRVAPLSAPVIDQTNEATGDLSSQAGKAVDAGMVAAGQTPPTDGSGLFDTSKTTPMGAARDKIEASNDPVGKRVEAAKKPIAELTGAGGERIEVTTKMDLSDLAGAKDYEASLKLLRQYELEGRSPEEINAAKEMVAVARQAEVAKQEAEDGVVMKQGLVLDANGQPTDIYVAQNEDGKWVDEQGNILPNSQVREYSKPVREGWDGVVEKLTPDINKYNDQVYAYKDSVRTGLELSKIINENPEVTTAAGTIATWTRNLTVDINSTLGLFEVEGDIDENAIVKVKDLENQVQAALDSPVGANFDKLAHAKALFTLKATRLAYAEAKANDPGGKVSNADFEAQMSLLTNKNAPALLESLEQNMSATKASLQTRQLALNTHPLVTNWEQSFRMKPISPLVKSPDFFIDSDPTLKASYDDYQAQRQGSSSQIETQPTGGLKPSGKFDANGRELLMDDKGNYYQQ